MTNSKTNLCGIYELPRTVAVLETGLTMAKVTELMDKFEKVYRRIVCSKTTNEIIITNWLKYNDNPSPKVQSAIKTAFDAVKDKELIKFSYSADTVCIPYPYRIDTVSIARDTVPSIVSSSIVSSTEPKDEEQKHYRGEYKNVLLSDTEYEKLKAEIPETDAYIEKLSEYMATHNAVYKSHYAVVRSWKRKDDAEGKKAPIIAGRPDPKISWLPDYMKTIQ